MGRHELVVAGQERADLQAVEVGALADQQAAAGQGFVDLDRGPAGLGQADQEEVGQGRRGFGAVPARAWPGGGRVAPRGVPSSAPTPRRPGGRSARGSRRRRAPPAPRPRPGG